MIYEHCLHIISKCQTASVSAAFELVMQRLMEDLEMPSETALAVALGMKSAAYFNRKRTGSIPYEQVIRLVRERKIDLDWVLGGIASLPPGSASEEGERGVSAAEVASAYQDDEDPWAEFELIERKGILGTAGSAGAENVLMQPRGAIAFRRGYLRYKNVTAKELIVADIDGDSMEKTLFHKDTVVFREQATLTADDIYLFSLEGRLFVKRLSFRPGNGIEVISDNRAHYPPFTLSEKEAEVQQFLVKGRFLWRGGDRLQ